MATIAPGVPPVEVPSPYQRKSGVLYFIGAGSPPEAIKIGVANSQRLLGRLRTIHSTNHRDPYLLAVVPFTVGAPPMRDAQEFERQLHREFASIRLRQHGTVGADWFAASPQLLEFIAAIAVPLTDGRNFPDTDEIVKMYCVPPRPI